MADKFLNAAGVQAIKNYIRGIVDSLNETLDVLMNDLYSSTSIEYDDNWRYIIYPDMHFEAWYRQSGFDTTITSQSGNLYRSDRLSLTLPPAIADGHVIEITHDYPTWGMLASIQNDTVYFYAVSGSSRNASPNYTLTAYVFGEM